MDNNKELFKIKQALKKIIKEVVAEETQSCFRLYKAKVITEPNGEFCIVQFLGDDKQVKLPYSSKVSTVSSGDYVWVATIYNSFSNAIVWETINFK